MSTLWASVIAATHEEGVCLLLGYGLAIVLHSCNSLSSTPRACTMVYLSHHYAQRGSWNLLLTFPLLQCLSLPSIGKLNQCMPLFKPNPFVVITPLLFLLYVLHPCVLLLSLTSYSSSFLLNHQLSLASIFYSP